MKRLHIVEYKKFSSTTVYSIHFDGKENNETDDFILRFQENPEYREDYQTIIRYIQKIGETGALERYFRPERKAKAIPIVSSKLRLYGIRISDQIIILGNGDIKTAKKVKNCPNCYPFFLTMNELMDKLEHSIRTNKISIENNALKGEMIFTIK